MEHLTDVVIFGFTAVIMLLVIIIIMLNKFSKLYNYFIRSEKDKNSGMKFSINKEAGLPPINSECPTKEELERLD